MDTITTTATKKGSETLSLAKKAVKQLNEFYGECIFFISDYHTIQGETVIMNSLYRYEGNDVHISFDNDGITGRITGQTRQFNSLQDLIDNIDSLFINQ